MEGAMEGAMEGVIEGVMEGAMEGGKGRSQAIETCCRLMSPTTGSIRQDPSGTLFQRDRLNVSESGFSGGGRDFERVKGFQAGQ
jgi:hypothetical protein